MVGPGGSRLDSRPRAQAPRLASPLDELRPHEEIVVVGSGYGGAIMACRLARAGRSVALLERGPERHPGDYPNRILHAARETQVRSTWGRFGRPTALFDFRIAQGQSVLVGCGLGGTSIINANVALRASDDVFDDPRWPRSLYRRGRSVLDPYYERAEQMLGSRPYPAEWPTPPKTAALAAGAEALDSGIELVPLNVTFSAGPNAAGVHQQSCTLCGDCCTGCNVGAKNTVLANYLPDARDHGARLFTEIEVRQIRREHGRWLVDLEPVGGWQRFGATPMVVTADIVVLAAGTLGSTEILLRSRQAGLSVSDTVGTRFSGNGDSLGFAYDTENHVDAVGWGDGPPTTPVGPTISARIPLPDLGAGDRGTLEEGAIPGLLATMVPMATAMAILTRRGVGLLERLRLAAHAVPRAARRTLTYLVMSTDDGDGQLRLGPHGLEVDWQDVGRDPVFESSNVVLKKAAEAIGGTYLAQPMWTAERDYAVATVHPLGGCVMADDAESGVVDEFGRVFAGPAGSEVYDGLLVADGSIVPRPVDLNPLLTISALAERAADKLASDNDWVQVAGESPPLRPPDEPPSLPDRVESASSRGARPRPSLSFSERLRGWIAPPGELSLEPGWSGRPEGSSLIEGVFTMRCDDVDALLGDAAQPMSLTGTVVAPALSPEPLMVQSGQFRLLEPVLDQVETWHMRYSMDLAAVDGRRFRLEGVKVIRDGPIWKVWTVTTTLYTRITSADEVVAVGAMTVSVGDLARMLSTLRVAHAGFVQSLRYRGAFLRLFLVRITNAFGGVAGELDLATTLADTDTRPLRASRPARLPEPEVAWRGPDGDWHDVDLAELARGEAVSPQSLVETGRIPTGEGATARLTHYRGGSRGPVLLAAGFGMAARSYLGRTTETNLTEFLVERDYDVWLFDYRASIDLPSRYSQFSLDEIATEDWPAAIAEVRARTGVETVQVFGHCVGAVSLLMALGAGLTGVRSAVCAQFSLHPQTSVLNRLKCALHLSEALQRIGVRGLAADSRNKIRDIVADIAFHLVPMPRHDKCGREVCRFVNTVYGCTHTHAQLNEATHRSLDDEFGWGNSTSLRHLALMMRRRLVVAADGDDAYTRYPDRFNLPIHFLVGARNHIFRPAGTERTVRWLRSHNDPKQYTCTVFPEYAHLDAIVGRDASKEVFPVIVAHLDATNPPSGQLAGLGARPHTKR